MTTRVLIEIRKLPAARWREYRRLRLAALESDPIAFGSSVQEEKGFTEGEWKRRIRTALFALEDDRPVGMVVVSYSARPKTRHVADIFGLYVSPSHRAKGIGTELIEEALRQILRNEDIVKVKLTVNPEQKAALRIYRRAGFEVAGRMKKELEVEGKYFDELIMEKMLPRSE